MLAAAGFSQTEAAAPALELLRFHAPLHPYGLLAQLTHHLHKVRVLPAHPNELRRFLLQPPETCTTPTRHSPVLRAAPPEHRVFSLLSARSSVATPLAPGAAASPLMTRVMAVLATQQQALAF